MESAFLSCKMSIFASTFTRMPSVGARFNDAKILKY